MTRERDRDRDRDPVPDPGEPATAAEKARADGFARLIDKLVDGDALPPAMEAEDRALIEVATIISASTRERELSAERRRAVIDQALERAVLGIRPARAHAAGAPLVDAAASGPKRPGVTQTPPAAADEPIPITRQRAATAEGRRESALTRALPWTVAAVAAAVAIILFVTRPAAPPVASAPTAAPTAIELEPIHRSRPADPLIGRIAKERAGDASARLDTIYADRLAGYRDLVFRQQLGGKR